MNEAIYNIEYQGIKYCNVTESDALAAGVPQADIDSAKLTAALAALTARRYLAETGGTSWNGHPVATDRQSQALVMGALLASMQPGFSAIDWKMADGTFVSLAAADVATLAQAIRAHVQAAFAARRHCNLRSRPI
jgi:hypothetical protein